MIGSARPQLTMLGSRTRRAFPFRQLSGTLDVPTQRLGRSELHEARSWNFRSISGFSRCHSSRNAAWSLAFELSSSAHVV
jgi:hypothetical protein